MLAPIVLFVYNRLHHVTAAIDALQQNTLSPESDLIVYSDAAKKMKQEERVSKVRSFIKSITGFKSVTVIERENNLGLANSIIDGVTSVVDRFGKVIVLEDDLITSKYFLQYMNDALEIYENEDDVISVHGYVYPVQQALPETFFLRGADCWGWATWKRGWDLFNTDSEKLLTQLKRQNLQDRFDFDNTYEYTSMLQEQRAKKIDSWAIRWYASAFLMNKLTLYPGRSLVTIYDKGKMGTHNRSVRKFKSKPSLTPISVEKINMAENELAWQAFKKFFISLQPSPLRKLIGRVRRAIVR